MADLGQKVKNALDEARILVLGAQVLLGFQYRAFMEPGFEKLPPMTQSLKVLALLLLLATLALLLLPAARHRLVEEGDDSTRLVGFTMGSMCTALLPFSGALGIDLFVAGEHVQGRPFGLAAGAAVAAFAVGLWYALPLWKRMPRDAPDEEDVVTRPRLTDRIVQVLTEARVVLPGAQALLGFQFAMVLMEAFDKLTKLTQTLHFASLCFVAATTVMLMAPAAWHRIAEQGEETERFERFAGMMVLASLASLALGLSLDLAVVTTKWSGSMELGLGFGAACLGILLGLWFGFTTAMRRRTQPLRQQRA